jgi:hypothetical protein
MVCHHQLKFTSSNHKYNRSFDKRYVITFHHLVLEFLVRFFRCIPPQKEVEHRFQTPGGPSIHLCFILVAASPINRSMTLEFQGTVLPLTASTAKVTRLLAKSCKGICEMIYL